MSVLNIRTQDQLIFIEKPVPILTSGNKNNDVLKVTFDETWDCENGKFYASFYIDDPKDADIISLTRNEDNSFTCLIPNGVLRKEGVFKLGVWCEFGDKTKTSNNKEIRVHQGAVTGNETSEENTGSGNTGNGGSGGKGINNMYTSSQDIPLDGETSKVVIAVNYTDNTTGYLDFLVPHGKDYVLTEEDKTEIAEQAADIIDIPAIGELSKLETENKDSLVDAINELVNSQSFDTESVPGDSVVIPIEKTKLSEFENDCGFITKADLPTTESYELIGETPLTLDETLNIKLVAEEETTYEVKTPTVWNFDNDFNNGNYELIKCTFERENDHYKVTSASDITKWHQSYAKMLIPVEANKTYTVGWENSASKKEPSASATDWGGIFNFYDGTDSSLLLVNGIKADKVKSCELTPTTNIIQIRYYPGTAEAPSTANVIGRFNSLWLNEGNTSTELTPIYNESGTFADVQVLESVPIGATITATPTAKVYKDVGSNEQESENIKNLLPLYGKKIVNFGDSIFGNARPPEDVSTYLAEKTGAEVLNCAFGGCRMAIHNQLGHWNAFTMVNLAEAIANGDYSVQDEALNYDDRTSYAEEPLSLIKATDFSKVDIVTIAYGTNDFTSNIPLDNAENPHDTTTLAGALRTSIESLLTAYPNLRIFVLSLAYRFYIDANNEYIEDSNTRTNSNNNTIPNFNAKLKEVAGEYNIPFVDNYNIGIGKFNRYQYFSVTDGTHHNETGRKLIAEHLAGALSSTSGHIPESDASYSKVEITTTSATLNPNVDYTFGEVSELTITFAEGNAAKRNEYMFSFTSGATATVLTLPSNIQWVNELTVEPNKRYEISVVDNIGLWCAVEVSE